MNPKKQIYKKEALSNCYDAVIIGSGMGGLTTAALLAKAGKKVLVAEGHKVPGGYAQAFTRKGYTFDSAVHLVGGCEAHTNGLIDFILNLLHVRDECNFIKVDPFYTAVFPDIRMDVPLGIGPYIDAHLKYFPNEANGFRQLVTLNEKLYQEILYLTEYSLFDLAGIRDRSPTLFKYRYARLQDVMDDHIRDSRLKALYSALWMYIGLPPTQISFLWWSNVLMSYIKEGASYCEGSFQKLVNAFIKALQANGGEIIVGNRVTRIIVGDRNVSGVILENGQKIHSSAVISNADALYTFEALVNKEYLPSLYLKELQKMEISNSAFLLYNATRLDLQGLNASYEIFAYKGWNHEEIYNHNPKGMPQGLAITIPSLLDPSLSPEGEHLVIVTTLQPQGGTQVWKENRKYYEQLVLDAVEPVLPGLKESLTFMLSATPKTLERYTMNRNGACYGWAATNYQIGTGRLPHITPIKGLYLTGHWTQPAGGIYGVILSGLQTARILTNYRTIGEFLRSVH